MRNHKKKKYTLLHSNGNKCLISNKSSRLCYCVTFCSNTMSEICISSQLCVSQGYWNAMTHQSRQTHKQCFSPFLAPLFSQKHSWTALTEKLEREAADNKCAQFFPRVSGLMVPAWGGSELTDAWAGLHCLCNFIWVKQNSHGNKMVQMGWPFWKQAWKFWACSLMWSWQWLDFLF